MAPTEVAAGVFRIPVHTPFGTAPTNAYVLRGDRVGLFDTGLRHARSRADLHAGLASLGLALDDVRVVFLSHAHVDHHGLAHEFRGAAVVGGAADVAKLRDFPAHMAAYAEAVAGLLPVWGVPAALVTRLEARLRDLLDAGVSVPWAGPLAEDAVVEGFGPPLRVLTLPGHTEGGIGLYRESDGTLLAGDHLLEQITPNPGLFTAEDPVTSGLGRYVASLERLAGMPVRLVLPGHGPPFSGVAARIREIVAHHEERADVVEEIFDDGRSVFQVVEAMFPGVDALNAFLALSEVFGHVELLRASGRLEAATESGAGEGGLGTVGDWGSGVVAYRRPRG